MTRRAVRKYPIEPLLVAMGMTLAQASPILDIGGPEYRRYRDQGMTRETAERKANKAGRHVYEVWAEMVEHDVEDTEAADEARRERRRVRDRKRYAKDPAFRERKRASARKHYAESKRAITLKKRLYRQAHPSQAAIRAAAWRRENQGTAPERRRARYLANRERELARQRDYDRAKAASKRPECDSQDERRAA